MNILNMLGAVLDYGPVQIAQSVLIILMAVLAIAIIVVVLMQKGTSDNIGAIGGESETYMGKNKGQDKERKLKIITCVLGAIIVVLAIVFFVLNII